MKTLLTTFIIMFLFGCSNKIDNPRMAIVLGKEYTPGFHATNGNFQMYVYPSYDVRVKTYCGITTLNIFCFHKMYDVDTAFYNNISIGDTLWLNHDIRKIHTEFE